MSLSEFEKELCKNIITICKNPTENCFQNRTKSGGFPETESDIKATLAKCVWTDYGVDTERELSVKDAFFESDIQFEKINTSIARELNQTKVSEFNLHFDLMFSPNNKEGEELDKVVEMKFPKNFWFEANWRDKNNENKFHTSINCNIASKIYNDTKNIGNANKGTEETPYPFYCDKNGSWKGKLDIIQYEIGNNVYVLGQHIGLMFVDFARMLQYAKQNTRKVELYFVAFFNYSDSKAIVSGMPQIIANYQEKKPTAFLPAQQGVEKL